MIGVKLAAIDIHMTLNMCFSVFNKWFKWTSCIWGPWRHWVMLWIYVDWSWLIEWNWCALIDLPFNREKAQVGIPLTNLPQSSYVRKKPATRAVLRIQTESKSWCYISVQFPIFARVMVPSPKLDKSRETSQKGESHLLSVNSRMELTNYQT